MAAPQIILNLLNAFGYAQQLWGLFTTMRHILELYRTYRNQRQNNNQDIEAQNFPVNGNQA